MSSESPLNDCPPDCAFLSTFGLRNDVPAPRVFLLLFESILSPYLGNHTV